MASSNPTQEELAKLIRKTGDYVAAFMTSNRFDASHDFNHINRVFGYARKILDAERRVYPDVPYDHMIVYLAALLHDIEDSKYFYPSLKDQAQKVNGAEKFLLSVGCPPGLANAVQEVIDAVSYSTEVKSPELVQRTLAAHPELAIVQDADRLDALGAIGIGRTFTYGAAKDKTRGMEGTLEHFDDKLFNLQYMMKTEEGRRLAKIRTERLRMFKDWWEEESQSM